MGTYCIKAQKDQLLELLGQFAADEKLGEPIIHSENNLSIKAYAPATPNFESIRCTWDCREIAGNTTIKIKIDAPALKMIGFYTSLMLLAVAMTTIGYLMNRLGIAAMGDSAMPFAFLLGGAGLLLYRKMQYPETTLEVLATERRFYERLRPYRPQISRPPDTDLIPSTAIVVLIILPMVLIISSLIRIVPLLATAAITYMAVLMIHLAAKKLTNICPYTTWRLMLLSWINHWMIVYFMSFLSVVFFIIFGDVISCLRKGREAQISDFVAPLQHWLGGIPPAVSSHGILSVNTDIFHQMIVHNQFNQTLAVTAAEVIRYILLLLTCVLLLWAMKGFVDWRRVWLLTHPASKPNLAPPSVREKNFSVGKISKRSIMLSLFSAGIGNILYFVLIIEMISVLFFDRAVFSYSVAQAIGWMILDFKNASLGSAQRSPLGIGTVMILMLPALVMMAIWLLLVANNLFWRIRCKLRPNIDMFFITIARKISSVLNIDTPPLCMVSRKKPAIVTRVPWLFGKPIIVINGLTTQQLDQSEWEAVIAHELAHVKYDVPIIRLSQWLSFVSAFPCNAFALMVDMEQREMRADHVAVEATSNRDAFITALLKVCTGPLVESSVKSSIGHEMIEKPLGLSGIWQYQIIGQILLLRPLFWPEFILGYAHPAVQDRFGALTQNR